MAYEISFLDDVESEFSDAITWYDEHKPGLGQVFFDDYLHLEHRLTENPYQFPIVFESLRQATFSHFPYSIFFKIVGEVLIICAIFNQKRNPGVWKGRI